MKRLYSDEIRSAFTKSLAAMYPDTHSLKTAAAELEISIETARQARDYGKGSVETLVGLTMYGLSMNPETLHKNLKKIINSSENTKDHLILEELIQQAIENYGFNELIAWLRLLNARHAIESELGIKKKNSKKKI